MALAVLALSLPISSCRGKGEEKEIERYVKCDTISFADNLSSKAEFPGVIKSSGSTDVSFRISGPIAQVYVKEGQRVAAGQVLAIMDQRDYQLQLQATQAEYDGIKSQVDRVVKMHQERAVSDADYDKAVHGLEQITVKLNAHRNALADTRLVAPSSGYVDAINFHAGETVAAGMTVVSLISSGTPEVQISVPAANYLRRDKMTKAECTIGALDSKTFPLKLVSTSAKANLNQLYTMTFSLPAGETGPTPGMSASVDLYYDTEGEKVLSIPMTALVGGDDPTSSCVWVISEGKAVKKNVAVKNIDRDGTAYISSGIADGDVVITAGSLSLKEGQKVRPLPKASKTNVGGVL